MLEASVMCRSFKNAGRYSLSIEPSDQSNKPKENTYSLSLALRLQRYEQLMPV